MSGAKSDREPHLVYIITAGISAETLLRGQLAFMRDQGFRVTVVCDASDEQARRIEQREGVRVVTLSMRRDMSPAQDIKSLLALVRVLRELKPDVVNASTPKAGLLGMLSATGLGVRARIYNVRGLRHEGLSGAKAVLLWGAEKISCTLATDVWCVSDSLRRKLIRQRLVPARKSVVLASGSSNGVDGERFTAANAHTRESLGIPADAPVLGFVGRLVGDKGIADLLRVYRELRLVTPDARLLCVGDFETGDAVSASDRRALEDDPQVLVTGFTRTPESYYGAMSMLVFPSKREGFPNVPLEAACAGIPTVGYAATGTVDVVVDGETGYLVAVGDVAGLSARVQTLATDDPERLRMGAAARARALSEFSNQRVWEAQACAYREELRIARGKQRGLLRRLKVVSDRTAGAAGLVVAAPVIGCTAALVRATIGSPVLFKQTRPGYRGRPFEALKFRTMTDARDEAGRLLPDVERLTRTGRFIRSLSLDELPQLFNVARGDMSLVGPRPLLMKYLGRYSAEQARRHDVLPGITGWAQVNGRNAVTWDKRLADDVWYVDHWSPWLDAKILLRTVASVARRSGISQEGEATMAEFVGTDSDSGEREVALCAE